MDKLKNVIINLRNFRIYWVSSVKDVFWIVLIGVLFFLFTNWIFNLTITLMILLVFAAKSAVTWWTMVETLLKTMSKEGPLVLATEDSHPALMGTIKRACNAAGIQMPPVYIKEDAEPNACAFGRSKRKCAIVVNSALQYELTPTELKAVIGHEIAHIVHGDSINVTVCLVFCEALEFQARVFEWIAKTSLGTLVVNRRKGEKVHIIWFLIIMAIALPCLFIAGIAHVISFITHLILKNLIRTRELRADAASARITRDPQSLIGAFRKLGSYQNAVEIQQDRTSFRIRQLQIANPLTDVHTGDSTIGIILSNIQRTHPPFEERIKRLNALLVEQRNTETRR